MGKNYAAFNGTKFHCQLARDLYGDTPDEELSSPNDAYVDWYGLYLDERAILHEDNQGFVYVTQYPSEDEVRKAWAVLVAELDKAYAMIEAGGER